MANEAHTNLEKKPKIAILYSLAGGGHVSVARALEESLIENYGIYPKMGDCMMEAGPIFLRDVSSNYNFFLKYSPTFWEFIVWAVTNLWMSKLVRFWIRKTYRKERFAKYIESLDADIIITTYFVYNNMLADLKEDHYIRSKIVGIATDMSHAFSLWIDKGIDKFIFPTEEFRYCAKKYFEQLDIMDKYPKNVMGQPISKVYFDRSKDSLLPDDKDSNVSRVKYFEYNEKIDIQSNPLKILYVSGGQGIGDMYEFCQQIDFGLSNVHIKVATGKNIDLAQKINNADFRNKIEAFGWVKDLRAYYNWADICIGKAGPSTVWEILTLNKPYICKEYIRGQENGNVDFAMRNGPCIYLPKNLQIIQFLNNIQKNFRDNIQEAFNFHTTPEKRKYFETNWSDEIIKEIITEYD